MHGPHLPFFASSAISDALSRMASLGATITDPADFLNIADLEHNADHGEHLVLNTEMKSDLEAYLEDLEESPVRKLVEVIK